MRWLGIPGAVERLGKATKPTDAVPGAGAKGHVAEGMAPVLRQEALRSERVRVREVRGVHMHVLNADDDGTSGGQHNIRCNQKQDGGAQFVRSAVVC
jgi:hypothetical protein